MNRTKPVRRAILRGQRSVIHSTLVSRRGAGNVFVLGFMVCLIVLVYLQIQYCAPAPPAAAVKGPAPAPESRLSSAFADGKVKLSGMAPDEKTSTSIMDQHKAVFGAKNVLGEIKVDPKAKAPAWSGKLKEALALLKKNPGAELTFDGNKIGVGGTIKDAAKTDLLSRLKALFGDSFMIADLALPAAVKPAQDLAGILAMSSVHFPSGVKAVPAGKEDALKKAADAIKAAPKGTKIEVAGYADKSGPPEANLKLSEARAEAVRAALVKMGVDPGALTAKGYGEDRPLAGNDTEDGRAKNRRVELKPMK